MTNSPEAEKSVPAGLSRSAATPATERVLLVGTTKEVGRQITSVLKDRNCEVLRAEAWNTVEDTLHRHPCQLIVFDLSRPRSGGHAALVKRILKGGGSLSVIIIAQEPLAEELRMERLFPPFHLAPPLSADTLAPVLSAALEQSRLLAENADLKSQVLFDDLTKAYNRRYLKHHLEEELERSSRYRHSFSILFADLDHLKSINDQYGHLYGSQVLRQVAEFFISHLRRSDKIFRFGGDEFVVTLPETDKRQAQRVVKRLSKSLPLQPLGRGNQKTRGITVSFGIATFPGDGKTGKELIQKADEDMYRAKSSR